MKEYRCINRRACVIDRKYEDNRLGDGPFVSDVVRYRSGRNYVLLEWYNVGPNSRRTLLLPMKDRGRKWDFV